MATVGVKGLNSEHIGCCGEWSVPGYNVRYIEPLLTYKQSEWIMA